MDYMVRCRGGGEPPLFLLTADPCLTHVTDNNKALTAFKP
jgi:hypothetical protein